MTPALTKDLVADPTRNLLELLVDSRGIDMATFVPAEDTSLIYRRIDFDQAALSAESALEESVYDNPLLLCQFRRTSCLIDTKRFLIVPGEHADRAPDYLSELYPDDSLEIICDTIDASGATLAAAVPRKTLGFLKRTFNNPRVSHRLTPLCRYFGHRTRFGNSGKLHVHLHRGCCDVIAFAGERLLMANTFAAPTAADASYFALAAAQELEFDTECDRMIVSGDTAHREELMSTLRRYIPHTMPMIFPSDMLRLGREAMDTPFEIIAGVLTD